MKNVKPDHCTELTNVEMQNFIQNSLNFKAKYHNQMDYNDFCNSDSHIEFIGIWYNYTLIFGTI